MANIIQGSSQADELFGTEVDDLILGQEGDDLINGNAGNDVIDGGSGNDTMNGGDGDDTFFVDSLGDTIVEGENGGIDTAVLGFAAPAPSDDPNNPALPNSYILAANLENAVLSNTAGETNVTGNDSDNEIVGNSSNNVLDGGTGDDTLTGGEGDDTYVVDSFGDEVNEGEDGGNDTVETSTSYSLEGVENVENLTLTGEAVFGGGNAGDNIVTGNDSSNTLLGGDGDDTLDAGGGNDVVFGDAGGDEIVLGQGDVDISFGGAGNDTFTVNGETSGTQTIFDFRAGDDADAISFEGLGSIEEIDEIATVCVSSFGTTIELDTDPATEGDEATLQLIGFTGAFDGDDDGTVTLAEINAVENGAFVADDENGGGNGNGENIELGAPVQGFELYMAEDGTSETFAASTETAGLHFIFGFDGTEDMLTFAGLGDDLATLEGNVDVTETLAGTQIALDTDGNDTTDATIILAGLVSGDEPDFTSLQSINDVFGDDTVGVSAVA